MTCQSPPSPDSTRLPMVPTRMENPTEPNIKTRIRVRRTAASRPLAILWGCSTRPRRYLRPEAAAERQVVKPSALWLSDQLQPARRKYRPYEHHCQALYHPDRLPCAAEARRYRIAPPARRPQRRAKNAFRGAVLLSPDKHSDILNCVEKATGGAMAPLLMATDGPTESAPSCWNCFHKQTR